MTPIESTCPRCNISLGGALGGFVDKPAPTGGFDHEALSTPKYTDGPPLASGGPPLAGDRTSFQASSLDDLFGGGPPQPQGAVVKDQRFTSRQTGFLIAGGVVAFLLLLMGLDALSGGSDGPSDSDDGELASVSIEPAVPYSVPPVPADIDAIIEEQIISPDKWDPIVADLVTFVEEARGLRFMEVVEVKRVTGEELVATMGEPLYDDAYLDAIIAEYRALGVLEGTVDLRAQIESSNSIGLLGLYESDIDVITVRNDVGTELGPFQRSVLVHELNHALQDQYFDLTEFPRSVSDTTMLRLMIEGDARRIEQMYVDSLSEEDRTQYDATYAELEGSIQEAGLIEVLGVEGDVIYNGGAEVTALVQILDSREALDTLLDYPPDLPAELLSVSTLFLHGGEPWAESAQAATYVGLDDGGLDVWDYGAQGAWLWYVAFGSHMDKDQAIQSADQIEADSYVLYKEGDRFCVNYELVARTEAGLGILHRGATLWADALPHAEVLEFDELAIRLKSCDPGPEASAGFTNDPATLAESAINRIGEVTEVLEAQRGWWVTDPLLERERWCLVESVQRSISVAETQEGLTSERQATLGEAAVKACLPTRGPFGLGPYEGECSADSLAESGNDDPILTLSPELPPAVAERAEDIAKAAAACDYSALSSLLTGNAPFLYTEVGVPPETSTDMTRSWSNQEERGIRTLSDLVSTLNSGWMCGDEVAAVLEGHEGGACAFMWSGDSAVDAEGWVTIIDLEGRWLGFGEAVSAQVELFELWSRVRVGRANTFEYRWSGLAEGAVLPTGWPSLVPPGASLLLD